MKTDQVRVLLSPDEKHELEAAAERANLKLGTWLRKLALDTVRAQPPDGAPARRPGRRG